MSEGFDISRPVCGSLTRSLPEGNRLCDQACLGIVMSQQLGLGIFCILELFLQYLRNLLV